MKLRDFFSKTVLAFLLAFSTPMLLSASPVQDELHEASRKPREDIFKQARSSDPADGYVLAANQKFYRVFNGKRFWLENGVQDFKISQHPNDSAYVYFIQGDCLRIMNQKEQLLTICRNVKQVNGSFKYSIVPSIDTAIVNMALTSGGSFFAWDNYQTVFTAESTKDYRLNPGFGSGRPFSTYVAFLIDFNGYVIKVRGQNPESSKADYSRTYIDLAEFMRVNDIR